MVSIIMSVYNVEKYLNQCLKSIFNQTYTDFELIIINDGSTDRSIDIINDYMKRFDNIIYIEQQNKGLSEARNIGLSVSKGEYILYVDSDDYLDSHMIQLMVEKIKVDDSDMVIVGHREFYDDITGKDIDVILDIKENQIYSGLEVVNLMLECKIMGVAWSKLYKRKQLIDTGFYFESGRYTQDWYPIFKHIANLKKISFVNKALYKYRMRATSTTSQKNNKRLNDYYYAVSNILNYIKNSNHSFNKNSIAKFKAITFNRIIFLYYSININNNNIYKSFKKEDYSKMNISLYNLLKTKNLDKRNKLYILAWNLKLYKQLIFIEERVRKLRVTKI